MNRRRKNIFWLGPLLVGGVLFFSLSVSGQWDKKPYSEWTTEDVQKILSESPWSQTHDLGFVNSTTHAGSVSVRLRSALPLRQALLRLRQIKAKYDKMSDKDKAAFDEKNKPLVDCPACDDNYVVSLSPGPGGQEGVPTMLRNMSLDEAKLNVQLLNDRGEKRALVHFAQPKVVGEDAVFFFARFDDKGVPLITPQSKTVIFSIGTKILSNTPIPKSSFTFEVAKMILDGKVVF